MGNLYLFLLFIALIDNFLDATQLSVSYQSPFQMKCKHNELSKTVKWEKDGDVKFECEPPYMAGQCLVKDETLTEFNIDSFTKTSSLNVTCDNINQWKENGTVWGCYHDHQYDFYNFTNTVSPDITNVLINQNTKVSVGDKIKLTCEVNSSVPYTVTISSERRGVLYTISNPQASVKSSVELTTECNDNIDTFTCMADNGESYPVTRNFEDIHVICDVRILNDEIVRTVNARLGSDVVLSVPYSGDKTPSSVMWYRQPKDGKLTQLKNYRIKQSNFNVSHHHSKQLIIYSIQPQDAGQYSVDLGYEDVEKLQVVFTVNIESDHPDKSAPFGGYVGVGIGAGGTLLIVIITIVIACIIHKKRNAGDDYLEPDVSQMTPPPPTLPPPCINSTTEIDEFESGYYENTERHN
ncbi:hypothetical protein SNE40_002452 [Patella caerulea]|uniref:Ig-like domain-containing protein n=1 Tax=Patella caerulea TaxID=87958 RepID=A0AAN8K150_PATCE